MNISYKWLKEYVDFNLSAEEVAKILTSIGLEVEDVEEAQSVKGGLKGIVVGEVLSCEPHPNSDHMHVCQVDLGGNEPAQIVCGAPNVAAGQKVMVATIGTKLYDGDAEFTIKKSKLRGIESYGMICAEDEIGVGNSHEGIIVLPRETKTGTPAAEYYNLESDYLIEADITPNRADAASHYGVARDLYAWLVNHGYESSLRKPSVEDFKPDNHDLEIDVRVENPEACPHYAVVTVKDCNVKESPEWLQNKLKTIGVRPINNIVDITNYVLFAVGQPLHCFDADMIKGNRIFVKTFPEGTPFITLDDEERKLSNQDLVICNAEEPMCIAGVLGGKGSGTYETTKNICFESAYFHPTWIRKSAKRHGLSTDASFRFERGVDPDGQIYALKLAALLTKELAGGTISMDIKEFETSDRIKNFSVDLSYEYVHKLIGKELPKEEIKNIVAALEMKITKESAEQISLEVPAYRVDVQRPCDVVEDILRIYGYNNIELPSSIQSCLTIEGEEDRSYHLQQIISEQLTGQGFREILNNSLTKKSYYDELNAYESKNLVELLNPLSNDLNVMRQTILFGGLESLARNINHKQSNLKFYEFGKCYCYNAEKRKEGAPKAPYAEDYHLGLWLCGKRIEGSWLQKDEESSVYEMKAYVSGIFNRLGLNTKTLQIIETDNNIFSKGLSVCDKNKKIIAEYGIVSNKTLRMAGIDMPVYYADLNWTELMKRTRKNKVEYTDFSKFPSVSRDLALLVDKDVPFQEIEKIAFNTEKKYLKKVVLFDVYEGEKLEQGKKSYAVNFILQDDTKTMNDKQTEAIMKKLIVNFEKQLNAKLR